MIDWDFLLVEIIASVREVSMNKMASPVVILVRILPAPVLPNIVWLLPAPSPEPIAAPLPDWSKMTTIIMIAPITCNPIRPDDRQTRLGSLFDIVIMNLHARKRQGIPSTT